MAETTGGHKYPEPTLPRRRLWSTVRKATAIIANRHRIARLLMREFGRAGHQRHHHQIRTDDRHMLKTQRQQLQWRRLFIERINEIFGPLRHARKMRSEQRIIPAKR